MSPKYLQESAMQRVLRRCPRLPFKSEARILYLASSIPSNKHATFALVREICKPNTPLNMGLTIAYDMSVYWPGGVDSFMTALAWGRQCAEQCPFNPTPYLFVATLDYAWRRTAHSVGTSEWYQDIEAAWHREYAMLAMEKIVPT